MKRVSARDKAEFYGQFAVLEDAGVPIDRALVTSVGQGRSAIAKRVQQTAALVSRGRDLAAAGAKARLFDDLDENLIRSAADSGKLASMLHRLAEFHQKRAEHLKTLQGRLLLPALVLILAIFIRPIPALILGKIDVDDYLSQTVFLLFKIALLIVVLIRLPPWLRRSPGRQLGFATVMDRLLVRVPVFGKVHVRRCVNRWCESLALLLEGGVPILRAMPMAGSTIGNTFIQREFDKATSVIDTGESLAWALNQNKFVSEVSLQFIRTGEESGTLSEMLGRCAHRQRTELQRFDQEFVAWAPRIIYFLILVWMAAGIIQSGGGLPRY